MSIRVMSWVWENSVAEGIDRLVLLAIADAASDDGGNAWPSAATLAAKTRVHVRTVQRSIQRLADMGELSIRANAGRNGVNVYCVLMGTAERHPGAESPRRSAVTKVSDISTNGYGTESPRQSATPAESPLPPGTAPPEPSLPTQLPKKTSSSSDRGTRLDPSWLPTVELIAWARSEGISDETARRETAKFIDYWRGIPGARGRKIDWPGTWRNWLRKATEQPQRPGTAVALPSRINQTASPRVLDGLALADRLRAQGE